MVFGFNSFGLAGVLWAMGFYKTAKTIPAADPKVKKSSAQTKTVHLSGIYEYIDFTKIDSRIIHNGIWKEGYPMQTTIKIPAKHHDEIMAKVEKAIAATKPNNTKTFLNQKNQPKVKKSSPQTKTVHLSGIYDYINFTKIDSRIIHDGLWKEGYPMQTTIEIPAKHHDEIMAKVEKAIAATKPNQTVRKNSNKF